MPKRRFHEESGASTIEGKNTLTGIKARLHHVEVRTLPLDAFGLTSVSVIKIDVEGHELAVLEGAVETIRGSRPAIFLIPGSATSVATAGSTMASAGVVNIWTPIRPHRSTIPRRFTAMASPSASSAR